MAEGAQEGGRVNRMASAPVTPYSKFLGSREPFEAIADSIGQIRSLAADWPPDRFERPYGPGKWTGRQVLTHLAQTELALGTRARMALATPDYVAQPWDQESWIRFDTALSGGAALDTFLAIAGMNLAFFRQLGPAEREIGFMHPEYGNLTVEWIIHQIAGHQINHLQQLQRIN
jgi:hypothetical protein